MRRGKFHIFEGNAYLQSAEGGNTVTDECEAIVIKLFQPNYLINESVWYYSWLRGAVKKIVETLRAP